MRIIISVVIQVLLFAAVLAFVVHFTLKMIRAQREVPTESGEARSISQAGAAGEAISRGNSGPGY